MGFGVPLPSSSGPEVLIKGMSVTSQLNFLSCSATAASCTRCSVRGKSTAYKAVRTWTSDQQHLEGSVAEDRASKGWIAGRQVLAGSEKLTGSAGIQREVTVRVQTPPCQMPELQRGCRVSRFDGGSGIDLSIVPSNASSGSGRLIVEPDCRHVSRSECAIHQSRGVCADLRQSTKACFSCGQGSGRGLRAHSSRRARRHAASSGEGRVESERVVEEAQAPASNGPIEDGVVRPRANHDQDAETALETKKAAEGVVGMAGEGNGSGRGKLSDDSSLDELNELSFTAGEGNEKVQVVSDGASRDPTISISLGRLLLFGVPLLWGIYGVTLRYIYSQPGPPHASVLTFVRKIISVAFFVVLLPIEQRMKAASSQAPSLRQDNDDANRTYHDDANPKDAWWRWILDTSVWRAGGELGLWSFLGTSLQAEGLEYTSATRAGFEIQITSILVPLLAALGGAVVPPSTWAAASLALGGVALLGSSTNGGGDNLAEAAEGELGGGAALLAASCTELTCHDHSALLGDAAVLAAAFFYAFTTVRLGTHAGRIPATQLTSANMSVALLMSAIWTAGDLWGMAQTGEDLSTIWESWQNGSVLLAVAFSAIGSGAIAALVQALGQSVVPPAEAQILYSLQPVWAALFAATLLGERIAPLGYMGGGIVLFATLLAVQNQENDTTTKDSEESGQAGNSK